METGGYAGTRLSFGGHPDEDRLLHIRQGTLRDIKTKGEIPWLCLPRNLAPLTRSKSLG